MRSSRFAIVGLLSGALVAGLAAQRGGGTRIAPGQECPPGTTETRPGNCQAPSIPPPSIVDYRPKSTLVTVEHKVPKARFPVIDIHSHQGSLTQESMKRLIETFFAGSAASAATALLGMGQSLSPEEAESLSRLIDQARERG